MYWIRLTFNDDAQVEYDATPANITNKYFTIPIYSNQEFAGLELSVNATLCKIIDINNLARSATCNMNFDLTSTTGLNQNIFTGAVQSKVFTVTPIYCGATSTIEYQVIYFPASASSNLISLSLTTSNTIVFAQSTNPNDAKTYDVTVNARTIGRTDWLTLLGTSTTTITYSDPC
jgi:hypothetical protein